MLVKRSSQFPLGVTTVGISRRFSGNGCNLSARGGEWKEKLEPANDCDPFSQSERQQVTEVYYTWNDDDD